MLKMLQRDYFIRLIQEFMAALQKFLEKKEGRDRDAMLRDLYRQYVGDYDLLRNLSFEEALEFARDQWAEDERVERLEMLAELYYAEGSALQKPMRDILLQKAFMVFDYVDANGKTFSLDRRQKMAYIRRQLGETPALI